MNLSEKELVFHIKQNIMDNLSKRKLRAVKAEIIVDSADVERYYRIMEMKNKK